MRPSPLRRAALLPVLGLVLALLPLLATSTAPAQAAGCLSESPGLLGTTCDDVDPPNTTAASGKQTAAGQVTVTASYSYGDGDQDPVGFECQLGGTATWGACVISNLTTGPHDVTIRAVDTADLALHPCVGLLCNGTEVPDYDASPETVRVTVTGSGGNGNPVPPPPGPNGAPETQISGGPDDPITPGDPVSLARRVVVQLAASGPATFNCAVNAKKVPCQGGRTVLKHLKPGPQVFVAQAVDQDGTYDATPASLTFFVPDDLDAKQGKGWKQVPSKTSYAGDYVSTTRKGAVLTLGTVQQVREIRLLAPTGPKLGKVAVRVGTGAWLKVRLTSGKARKLHVFELRPAGAGALSGALVVKAVTIPAGGTVAVDAIVAR